MPSIGFVAPLLPGKTEMERAAMTSCWTGDRRPDFERSRKNLGITREAVFIQSTPDGDVDVIYWEAEDVEAVLNGMAKSYDPFDRWFRGLIRDVHGINVEDGFPPPEQIMDYRA